MATATRIYHINMEGLVYLVRASHPSAALMHVARNVASVRVASQDDLVNSIADGVKVESAAEEAPAPAKPAGQTEPLWPLPAQASDAPQQGGQEQDPEPGEDDGDEDRSRPAQDGEASGGVPQRFRVPAKYRCPATGSSWSGRGIKPAWLRAALDAGRSLEDFLVAEPAPAGA